MQSRESGTRRGVDADGRAASMEVGRGGADAGARAEPGAGTGAGAPAERAGARGPDGSGPELDAQAGMVTAEYAIATLAAAAFAGVLLAILRSAEVRAFLLAIIRQALSL